MCHNIQPGLGFEGNLRIAVYTSTILDSQMTCQTLAKEMNPNSPSFLDPSWALTAQKILMELSKTSWCPSRFNPIVFNLDLVGFDAEGSSCLWWCRKARQKRHGSDRAATWELGDHVFQSRYASRKQYSLTTNLLNSKPAQNLGKNKCEVCIISRECFTTASQPWQCKHDTSCFNLYDHALMV